MPEENPHYTTLKGKTFVLYSGLLAMAFERGIQSIEEEIVQIPTADNGEVSIVKAKVTSEDGRIFHGIGDASPNNVSRNIAPHSLRMASTRAKARALRDFCNIGVTSLEELGDDDAPQQTSQQTSQARTSQPRQAGQASEGGGPTPFHATEAQIKKIHYELKRIGMSVEQFEERFKVKLDEFPKQRASGAIDWLTEQESDAG